MTLGCSKNTVDSEVLMRQMRANDLTLWDDPATSDVLIINTCGFIEEAKQESINAILEAENLRNSGKLQKLYVAGCLSERYRSDLQQSIRGVDRFFGAGDFRGIIEELGGEYRTELLGERFLTTPSHLAYLKISEGCDNPCSFCAIPIMRGKHVSKPLEELVRETTFLAQQGVREINIIAQDTTYYGLDLYGKRRLDEALHRIAGVDGIEWIRLLYAYPSGFPLELLDVMNNHPNICRYLDMPIQHIADTVLRSMRRGITGRSTTELIARVRDSVPGIALRTTLIVGYPTESDKDFEQLLDFVRETRFDRLGVFTYSPEEDTSAESLGDPVPRRIKEERRNAIMELQREISLEENLRRVGSTMPTLLERVEGEYIVGRTERDAPEIDNEVLVHPSGPDPALGRIFPVRITGAEEYDLIGELEEFVT